MIFPSCEYSSVISFSCLSANKQSAVHSLATGCVWSVPDLVRRVSDHVKSVRDRVRRVPDRVKRVRDRVRRVPDRRHQNRRAEAVAGTGLLQPGAGQVSVVIGVLRGVNWSPMK